MVITKKESQILYIGLNVPEKRNALSKELMLKLMDAFEKAKKDSSLSAVVLYGEGKSFCAGADLNWMKNMVDYSLEDNIKDSNLLFELFYTLYNFPLPIICKAQGPVFGGALGLLATSDYVLCDENIKLCFSEVKLGLIPAVISSFILAKCSPSMAQALMTSGKLFNFTEAKELGLIHDKLSNFDNILNSYKESDRQALIESKKLILSQRTLNPLDFKLKTVEAISKIRITPQAQKRMNAFLNRSSS